MGKLLLGMILLGSIVFAEPMPEGTPQDKLAQNIVSAALGYTDECKGGYNVDPNFQWICAYTEAEMSNIRLIIDLQLLEYEVKQAWMKVNMKDFVKRVDFEGHDFVISLQPKDAETFMLIGMSTTPR